MTCFWPFLTGTDLDIVKLVSLAMAGAQGSDKILKISQITI